MNIRILNSKYEAWVIQLLDLTRISILRLTLGSSILRKIYRDRASRLALNFISLFALYLFISLKFSIVLLVLGPLIFGYPHLIASYRFLHRPAKAFFVELNVTKIFRLFLFLTGLALYIRFIGVQYKLVPALPYGSWEILLSIGVLGFAGTCLKSIRHFLAVLMTVVFALAVLGLASWDPLAFIGFALIIHNWVAFAHWIVAAQDKKNKIVALAGTVLFALLHIFIYLGFFDGWISVSDFNFISSQSFDVKGWALAPWSTDPMMWDRIMVLYTFGLSMHYFIWLQAIPQSLDQKPIPNSFKRSFEQLHNDCGRKTIGILFLGAVLIVALWCFTSFAGRIYFGIAMLHGWLELIFLSLGFFSILLKINTSNR